MGRKDTIAIVVGVGLPLALLLIVSIIVKIIRRRQGSAYQSVKDDEEILETERIVINDDDFDNDLEWNSSGFDIDFDDDELLNDNELSCLSQLERFRNNLVAGTEDDDDEIELSQDYGNLNGDDYNDNYDNVLVDSPLHSKLKESKSAN